MPQGSLTQSLWNQGLANYHPILEESNLCGVGGPCPKVLHPSDHQTSTSKPLGVILRRVLGGPVWNYPFTLNETPLRRPEALRPSLDKSRT